jgi:tRNA (cmo5U34)-methyltransferase
MSKIMTKTTTTKQKLSDYEEFNSSKEEWSSIRHVMAYLNIVDTVPHRMEGEAVLLDHVPYSVKRVLDLGTGNGRLLKMIRIKRPNVEAVGIDISPAMLKAAKESFFGDPLVKVFKHDLNDPLRSSELGTFDVIVTSLAIHHLTHTRKHSIYKEIYSLLNHGGVFCNLEHVDSPTKRLHEHFMDSLGDSIARFARDEYSDRLLSLDTQLRWLKEIGFVDVDCYWKWLELALLIGIKS